MLVIDVYVFFYFYYTKIANRERINRTDDLENELHRKQQQRHKWKWIGEPVRLWESCETKGKK